MSKSRENKYESNVRTRCGMVAMETKGIEEECI